MYEQLRRRFSTFRSSRCSAEGCELRLSRTQRVFVLDFERYCGCRNVCGHRCDFLVFICRSQPAVFAVEIKSGRDVEAGKVVTQLQQGADQLARLLDELDLTPSEHLFFPLLVCAAVKHANELKILSRRRINYRGQQYPILFRRCGTRIQDILDL